MADERKPLPRGAEVYFATKHWGIVVAYDDTAEQYTVATGPVGNPDRLVKVNLEDVDGDEA